MRGLSRRLGRTLAAVALALAALFVLAQGVPAATGEWVQRGRRRTTASFLRDAAGKRRSKRRAGPAAQ
jgi:hypothetical protein